MAIPTFTNQEYVENGGKTCPFCGDEDIEGIGNVELDDGIAALSMSFCACQATWTEIYHLAGYTVD